MRFVGGLVCLFVPGWASAACETQVQALGAAEGAQVASAFTSVVDCDPKTAGDQLGDAVKRTGDVQSLVTLTQAALSAGLVTQVHGLLDQIPDYAAREETVRAVGSLCQEDPAILAFVTGLHSALRDRAFVAWSGAIRNCPAPELTATLETLAARPPTNAFDDKYATVVDLYAARRRVDAIPVLERAAIASAKGGPFPVVIDALVKAATPDGIGTRPTGAAREALVGSLERIAPSATPDQVTVIADKLVAMGAEDAAARLLPHIYPDRVQPGGGFLYGVAAIEMCAEDTLVHWAVVQESGKRWMVGPDVEEPAQGFVPRLKCKEPAPFTVVATPGPVASGAAVAEWAATVAAGVGTDVKLREEPGFALL